MMDFCDFNDNDNDKDDDDGDICQQLYSDCCCVWLLNF